MQLTSTSPTQTVLLVGVILALAGLGGAYEFLLPRLQSANAGLAQANAELVAANQNLTSLKAAKSQVDKVDSNLAAVGVSVAKTQEILPATEGLPNLYIQMESIVAAANATIGSPTYQLGTPALDAKSNEVQIPITVSGNGQYSDLKKFLRQFEQNIRPVSFTQVGFSVASAAVGTPGSAQAVPSAPPAASKGPITLSATGFISALGLSPAYSASTPTH